MIPRFLIICNSAGGFYNFRRELLAEYIHRKIKVFISAPYDEKAHELEKMGAKYIRTEIDRRGTNPFSDFKLFLRYVRMMKKIKPDVVLTYTIKPNVYGGIACQITGIPYLANVTGLGSSIENGGFMQFLTTTLYKVGLRKAKCVFFQNKNNQAIFLQNHVVKGHTRLIPGSGVNLNYHRFEDYPDESSGIRFLFVGRIMRDKGIEELLSAINEIHKLYPSVSLDIIGGSDEDYSSVLKENQKKGFIRYHGNQDDVHSFYRECHCVVLPSYHEGMANVLLEASSTGRPVIASNIPGCRETFDEGVTGFGCEARNVDSLIEALGKFMLLSNNERADMGVKAREWVKKGFDRSIIVKAYLNESNKIIKRRNDNVYESL